MAAKRKNNNKNKALDSNIIINLFEIHNGTHPDYYHQSKDFLLSVYHIYDLVQDSDYNFYITPSVLSELKEGVEKYNHDEGIFDFMADMGIELKTVPDELQPALSHLRNIYLGKNKHFDHLPKAFKAENASDAQIMAEATILDLDVITNNTKHFIGPHQHDFSIQTRILAINNTLGYRQGIPNTSLQFIKRKFPEYFNKHGELIMKPKSLALAPLNKPKTKKEHRNKYENPEAQISDEILPTSYHEGDFPTHYSSTWDQIPLDYDNDFDDNPEN